MTLICTNNYHDDDLLWINADKIKAFSLAERTEILEGKSTVFSEYLASGGHFFDYTAAKKELKYYELRVEIDGTEGFLPLARSYNPKELAEIMHKIRVETLLNGSADVSAETENANLAYLEEGCGIQKTLNEETNKTVKDLLEKREGVEK